MDTLLERLGLERPRFLDDEHWHSITTPLDRVNDAVERGDHPSVIGNAKELAEAVAGVVVTVCYEEPENSISFEKLIGRAHDALQSQPGAELCEDSCFRHIAGSAQKMIRPLGRLRNSYGSGHGRAVTPQPPQETGPVILDAVRLWTRWALTRLTVYQSGLPSGLIRDLDPQARTLYSFEAGEVSERLVAADLSALDVKSQYDLGLAVGRRSAINTWLVRREAVEPCAESDDLDQWPAGYRQGVADGLFFDRRERVSITARNAEYPARLIRVIPDPHGFILALLDTLEDAEWTKKAMDSGTETYRALRKTTSELDQSAAKAWDLLLAEFARQAGIADSSAPDRQASA